MSNICIKLLITDTPAEVAGIYYNNNILIDFTNFTLKMYIHQYSRRNNLSREEVEKLINEEYTRLELNLLNNTISFEEKSNKNDMNDSLEEKPSLQSTLGLTAAQWNAFGIFVESKLKMLNWRFPGDQLRPINTEDELNEAIKEVLMLTFSELVSNAYINSGVDPAELNTKNIYLTILKFFENDNNKVAQSSKYYNHYLFLKNPDTAILLILSDRVKIPTGFFNIYNNDKLYRFNHVNKLQITWSSDEDNHDDMENIPKVTKSVLESIPRFEYIGKKFVESNTVTTFNGIILGFNLLLRYLYDVRKSQTYDYAYDFLSQMLDEDRRSLRSLGNILAQFFDLSSSFEDYIQDLRGSVENLYSLYKFLQKLEKAGGFNELIDSIHQTLLTTTYLKFNTYEYNKDGKLVYKEYDPLDSDRSLSSYSKLLALLYSNNLSWIDFTFNDYISNSNFSKTFQIPDTNITVNLSRKNKNILVYTLSANGEKIEFTFAKQLDLDFFNKNPGIKKLVSKKDLATILRIPYNELFDNLSEPQPYILAIDLIKNAIANQLIQSKNSVIINPVYRSTIQSSDEFIDILKLISGGTIVKGTAVDLRNSWTLLPYQVNFYDIYKPTVHIINSLLHKPVSTIVKTQEGTNLNLNKSFLRGNVFYESTAPQRLDGNSPSNHFILYQCFVGGHVLRDAKNNQGEVKKAIHFNPEEYFTASFIYDYFNRLNTNTVSLMGPIVSDKPWIPRIDVYIDKNISINDTLYNLKTLLLNEYTGSTLLLKEFHANELLQYYQKQKYFVKDLIQRLHDIILKELTINGQPVTVVSLLLNLLSKEGITLDEDIIKSWFENDYQSFNDSLISKSIKEKILHELIVLSQKFKELPEIDWIENLCNCWDGNNLIFNKMLDYNLLRYNKNYLGINSTAFDEWFTFLDDLFISDIIKNGFNVKDVNVLEYKDNDWINNQGYHIFAKVSYDNQDLNITNNVSLDSWKIYAELKAAKRLLDNIDSSIIPNNLFIESPEFSITNLIEFLNTDGYVNAINTYRTFLKYKALLEETNPESTYQEIIDNYFDANSDEIELLEIEVALKIPAKLTFNPILLNYNLITTLFEEEFLNATVGTYLTHPTKNNPDIKTMIKNARGALVKRNVILSATKSKYLTGRLRTIPDKIKIAIIENLSNDVFNLLADELGENKFSKKLLTDDGAMLVDGSFLYLENYSLYENAVGLDKKLFGSYVNPKSGSGFILKTAGFAITNDLMRRSPQLYYLSKRMRSLPLALSINLNDFAEVIEQQNLFKSIPTFNTETGEVTYTHYKLVEVGAKIGENKVDNWVKWVNCDEFGNLSQDPSLVKEEFVSVNSIWELYENVLGGIYTSHLAYDGLLNKLTSNNCDSSNIALANIMCIEAGLLLKNNLIAYAPTREAVKYGISNPNTKEVYTDSADYTISYMTIDTFDLGVLLDAEHSAFESRVSIMTLVMNAAAARGYSIKEGDAIYDALHKITLISILDCFEAFTKKEIDVTQKAKNLIATLILNVLKSKGIGASNLLDVLTSTLHKEIITNNVFEQLIQQIPIDDPTILRLILSKFTSSLQSHAIRLKFPGGLYVLAPSDGRILLWAGKTLDQYGGKITPEVMEYLENLTEKGKIINNFGHIRFGKSYRYTENNETKTISINDPEKYWQFKKKYQQRTISEIKEDFTKPYDLGCEDVIYSDNVGNSYHIWDLYEVWNLWYLMLEYHKIDNNAELNSLDKQTKLDSILQLLQENQSNLLEKLNRFKDNNEINSVDVVDFTEIVDGIPSIRTIEFNRAEIKQIAFEAILPKYLKKRFNLTDFDNLSDIVKDKNFFYKKRLKELNQLQDIGLSLKAHICLLGSEFNTYLLYTDLDSLLNMPIDPEFEEILVNFTTLNGEKWLLSKDGQDLLLKLPLDSEVRIFKHKENNQHVIITKDIKFFIDQSRHTDILYFKPNDELQEKLYELLKTVEELLELFESYKDSTEFWNDVTDLSEAITKLLADIKEKPDNKVLQNIRRNTHSQHGALLDSLNFIASRTPAQCHQSFMSMHCVAFDHSERNVAYVSRWLLWLLGSDFDIDKVNIISHHVYNGKMRQWSYYLKYNRGFDYINIGNQMPLPTGQPITIEAIDEYDYSDLNNINIIHFINNIYKNILADNTDKYKEINAFINLTIYTQIFKKSISEAALLTLFGNFVANEELKRLLDLMLVYLGILTNGQFKEFDESSNLLTVLTEIENILSLHLNFDISDEIGNIKNSKRLINSKEDLYLLSVLLWNNKSDLKIPSLFSNILSILQEIIDAHNLYLENKDKNILLEAYENFVSKSIWNISIDPRNWILGLISVDTSTGPWKDLANLSQQATESKRFVGASVVGIIKLLTLTLEGKLNVGIVANSLKTLEAISHSIYKTLEEGTNEEILKLWFELEIHGKTINSIANAWVRSSKLNTLDEKSLNILRSLDQSTDAFIQLSSLLSLAVDNAKDPTLSKINGNLNMIGLYTTGIILGISKEDLIDIINSPTGRLVSQLMLGNIFYNKKGFTFFDEVIDFLDNPPSINFNSYGDGAKELKSEYQKKFEDHNLTDIIDKIKDRITTLGSSITEEMSEELKQKVTNRITSLNNILNRLYKYSNYFSILKFDTYLAQTTDKDGNPTTYHRPRWYDLKALMRVNSEYKQINKGTKLNLGLSNSIEELLQSLNDLSRILDLMRKNAPFLADPKDSKNRENIIKSFLGDRKLLIVDMLKFLSDENYRLEVFDVGDILKRTVNPYRVFWDVAHYRGYLESLVSVIEGSKLISKIYSATVTLYPKIITSFNLNSLEKLKVIKLIEEFYHRKRNKLFFEYLGNLFTFTITKHGIQIPGITLNSESNRLKFKEIVEREIYPYIKRKYKDNSFVQSLRLMSNTRTIDHNEDVMIGSDISTLLVETTDRILFLEAKQDMYKLLNINVLGAPLISVLFLYNLIATDNLNIANSITPFFEDFRNTSLVSIILKYDDFIKDPKDVNNESVDLIDDEDIELLQKYCAPIRQYLDLDTKSLYRYLWDKLTKKYNLVSISEEDDSGNKYPIIIDNKIIIPFVEPTKVTILLQELIYSFVNNTAVLYDLNGNVINTYDRYFLNVDANTLSDVNKLIELINNPNKC